MLDLPLILQNSSRVLCLGRTGLPRDCNDLFRVIVSVELSYTPCDGRLLACRELIFGAGASCLGGSAFFVLRVNGDLGGIIARVNDIGPAWCDGGSGVG